MNTASHLSDELKSILVVDDEMIVLTALRETLRLEGYTVVATPDALQALEEIQKTRFSVILTDQQMPMLTGLEFLAQAKEVQPDATRILITAVLSLNTVIDAINKGEIYRFIVKPWLREELLVTIKNAVQRFDLIQRHSRLGEEMQALNAGLRKDLAAQQTVAQQLEIANQALRSEADGALHLLLKILAGYEPRLGARSHQALEICRIMSTKAQLGAGDSRLLETAALLHDIGLINAPREPLRQWLEDPESLAQGEAGWVRQHPLWGEELVNSTLRQPELGTLIRAHQERFDGGGYPDGLAGARLPWLARLLALAAAYAAAPGEGKARELSITSQSGSAFDPEAVRLFIQCLPAVAASARLREVPLSGLRPGMVLAKGVYNAKGALLMPEGRTLSELQIQFIRNQEPELTPGQFMVYG